MNVKIVKGKALPIGLDPGSSTVKLAQLQNAAGKLELLAADVLEVPQTARSDLETRLAWMGGKLSSVVKSGGFRGKQCILSLPAESIFLQHVKVPKLSPEETQASVAQELQGKLPYPVEQAIVRHVVAGEIYIDGEPRQEVVVIAAPRSTLNAYIRMARKAKLDPVGVNVEACALVECFARLFRRAADAARTLLFVDLGARTTQVVLSHGPRLVFARNLAKGAEGFDEVVAKQLGTSIAQAQTMRRRLACEEADADAVRQMLSLLDEPLEGIAEEINQCLRYYEANFRNQRVDRIIFVGGQATDKRLCQDLAKRLNLPAQIGDPLLRVRLSEGVEGRFADEPTPHLAVAVGLSIGAAAEQPARSDDQAA